MSENLWPDLYAQAMFMLIYAMPAGEVTIPNAWGDVSPDLQAKTDYLALRNRVIEELALEADKKAQAEHYYFGYEDVPGWIRSQKDPED